MIHTFIRNNIEYQACAERHTPGMSIQEKINNSVGCWLKKMDQGNHDVYEHNRKIEIDVEEKTVTIKFKRVYLKPDLTPVPQAEYPAPNMIWGGDTFEAFATMEYLGAPRLKDILRRMINGVLEREGCAYLFHPVSLVPVIDENDAIAVSPHMQTEES